MNYQQRGVTLYRQIGGSRAGEAVGLNGIGETLQASGAAQDARMRHTDALLAATKAGDSGLISLWAGQGAPLAREVPARELAARIVREADAAIARL